MQTVNTTPQHVARPDAPEAREVRDALLAGFATDQELAAALGCSVRSLYRLNLPFVKIVGRRYRDIAKCREALLSRQASAAPRGRGRPRKVA